MSICFFTSVHYPFDFRIFHKECKSLAETGYAVTLVALHNRDETVEGVRILGLRRPGSRMVRLTVTGCGALWRAWKEHADVYHFHDPELIWAAVLLRLAGKKVVRDVREDLPRQILDKHYLPKWSRRIVAIIAELCEIISAKALSGIVAATPLIANRFEKHNRRTVLVRNFPDIAEVTESATREWGNRENWVIYLGSISEARGIRHLIRAMELMPAELNVRLRLAGEFSPSRLQYSIGQMEGWRTVDYLGRLERSQIFPLLLQGRVGVLTLEDTPHIRFSWPVKLFEYMLAGLPVVASDIPLWRRIIEEAECGLLVDPMNPKAIADAITYLLENPSQSAAMGHRGREAVKRSYNWNGERQRLLSLYADLAGAPKACRQVPVTITDP
ncbi:MAG: glycosyltransferase family 4 protein [Acidobacteriaceae bacterium]|nr:glycosyltransferase family 4 protein [Acidobacteriaceae bacterium]